MTHLSEAEIEGYRSQTLAPAQRLAVSDHLTACPACREQLAAAAERDGRLTRAFASLRANLQAQVDEAPFHLSDEQMLSCVGQTLDGFDQENAAAHLEGCERCTAAVEELRRFQALMSSYPAREHHPAPSPKWRDRLHAFLGRPAVRLQVQAVAMTGAAAAVAILLVANRQAWHQVALSREAVRLAGVEVRQLRQDQVRAAVNRGLILDKWHQDHQALQAKAASAGKLQAEVGRLNQEQKKLRQETEQLRQRRESVKPPLLASAPLELLNHDGPGRVVVDPHGNVVRIEPLPAAVRQAVRTGRVPAPLQVAELGAPPRTLMGGSEERPGHHGPELIALSPVGQVVGTDQPIFTWRPLSGATRYRIAVYDLEENPVAGTPADVSPGPKLSWGPGPDHPLGRGGIYEWEVFAYRGDEQLAKTPPAKFRVLEAAKLEELQRYANSPLTHGVLAAEDGLLDEAEHSFQQVLKENPRSRVAKKLLASVRAMRHTQR